MALGVIVPLDVVADNIVDDNTGNASSAATIFASRFEVESTALAASARTWVCEADGATRKARPM
jgi:hypothetical protein